MKKNNWWKWRSIGFELMVVDIETMHRFKRKITVNILPILVTFSWFSLNIVNLGCNCLNMQEMDAIKDSNKQ